MEKRQSPWCRGTVGASCRSISGRQCEQAMVVHQEPDRENHQHKQQVHDMPLLARGNGLDLACRLWVGAAGSIAADSSPCCRRTARIAVASASRTTNIREACASLDPDQGTRSVHVIAFSCRSGGAAICMTRSKAPSPEVPRLRGLSLCLRQTRRISPSARSCARACCPRP
jgi:hypothetical protein